MIKYMPDNQYFNWDIPANVPTEHWQQVLTNIPYEEIVKFLNNNPAIKHAIDSKCKPIDYFALVQEVMTDAVNEHNKQTEKAKSC